MKAATNREGNEADQAATTFLVLGAILLILGMAIALGVSGAFIAGGIVFLCMFVASAIEAAIPR